jgi:tetratricopeptide (TPR) repeat protein
VVYDPARETDLRLALGAYADPAAGAGAALEAARAELSINPDDAWGWFGMGTAYVALGDYENAVIAYDQALQLGLPWRTLWYQFGPYEAYFHVGTYNNVLALAENTLATTRFVEEAYFWKGMALAAEGDPDAAGDQFAEASG